MTTTIYVARQATKSRKETRYNLQKKVMTFASCYAKINPENKSWSEILTLAWDKIQANSEKYIYIKYKNVKGEILKRIALNERWSDRFEVKGTGTPLKPGQRLYLDACKEMCGKEYFTGSYYKENLIEKF